MELGRIWVREKCDDVAHPGAVYSYAVQPLADAQREAARRQAEKDGTHCFWVEPLGTLIEGDASQQPADAPDDSVTVESLAEEVDRSNRSMENFRACRWEIWSRIGKSAAWRSAGLYEHEHARQRVEKLGSENPERQWWIQPAEAWPVRQLGCVNKWDFFEEHLKGQAFVCAIGRDIAVGELRMNERDALRLVQMILRALGDPSKTAEAS